MATLRTAADSEAPRFYAAVEASTCLVYVGVSVESDSEDAIYVYRLDRDTGALSELSRAAGVSRLNYMTFHPQGQFLYAVGNTREMDDAVVAFAVDRATGALQRLNVQSAAGAVPCHLSIDPNGRAVLVANYLGGNVASLPIQSDGRLQKAISVHRHVGPASKTPRAHSILFDPTGRFACAAELGLDQVRVYRFDQQSGALAPNDPPFASMPVGRGPRHGAFHPSGKYFYVINETDCTLTLFAWDSVHGTLAEQQTLSTIPIPFADGFSTAELFVHPNGRFVFGSNRGHDTIATFSVDDTSGRLTAIGHAPSKGKTPRNFAIDPSGRFLLVANQEGDSLVSYRIDDHTGKLQPTELSLNISTPMCIRFLD